MTTVVEKELKDLVIHQALKIKELEDQVKYLGEKSIIEYYKNKETERERLHGLFLNDKLELGILHGKPHSEVSKLKLFIEIFNAMAGDEKNDVAIDNFLSELVNTGKFTVDEAKTYLKKAMGNGQIFERRDGGWLAKT